MADFEALNALRKVLLSPLSKVRLADAATEGLPSHGANSTVSRHDHHNVEIKTVSELGSRPSKVETDIYLFVPRSFEITSVGKVELVKDFRSRIRLALPSSSDVGAAALESSLTYLSASLAALEEAELAGEHIADLNHLLADQVLEATKDLCAVIGENLKHGAFEHVRQFFLSHTLMTTPHASVAGLEALGRQVLGAHDMIVRTRKVATSQLQSAHSIFSFFDEYMSQLYIQYLGTIRTEFAKIVVPRIELETDIYHESRKRLERQLDSYQEEEALHRAQFLPAREAEETDLDREHRLVRMGHLKKFFQSKTFIDVSREASAAKISQSTATIGTALAAVVAAMIERFSRSGVTDAAVNGVMFISLGVIFYTIRDRLKDWTKVRFQEKALSFLPDFQQQLVAKEKRIGVAKEWFHLIAGKDLPPEVSGLRKSSSSSEMERRLPEDVFRCRKVQEVNATGIKHARTTPLSQALHENTRINFERYLKHMDDPFKEITDLDPSGRFRKLRSHRVYHFYLCVKTVTSPLERKAAKNGPRQEQTLLYRIVLDKRGVVRIEDLAVS